MAKVNDRIATTINLGLYLTSMSSLLYLLQLVSSSLPVGAYSYSEGIETLVSQGKIKDQFSLQDWLIGELRWGSIRLEAAMVVRAYAGNKLDYWNDWLSAIRETQELKNQSQQMGYSLLRLLASLEPDLYKRLTIQLLNSEVNFAIVFGALLAYWKIPIQDGLLGFLHSWANNLVSAGLKLIPLGQTEGQKILLSLQPVILENGQTILNLADDDLYSCGVGLSLASMAHAELYTRLFRS